jgi:hypothetical protein
MHIGFTSIAHHEPDRLDSNPADPTQPNPTNLVKGPFYPTFTSFGARPGDHHIVFSQCFLAHKILALRFHRCGSHILKCPPLVPRLGDKPTPSPKSKKSHPVLLP